MLIKEQAVTERANRTIKITADLAIAGGGMSGCCAAIMAARKGLRVVLVQDRPVLGGNASSEVRLWILGATSHMGNNNRWAREGGIINEILIENLYRNKEGNPLIFDTIMLEKISNEPNITLLLNTAVYEVDKSSERAIRSLKAFCSQNGITYELHAPLFCDASGDGIVGFLSGAAFRMGVESQQEFGEKIAPKDSQGDLLGHSIYFYSKRNGSPVKYVPPSFAMKDISEIPKYKVINPNDYGCRLWWIEYGGKKNTVYDSEDIKWELWKVVYGVWNYIKNSGKFEDVDDLTLEWVGTIPGKRESRRFEGLYMLKQADITGQQQFDDAVAYGGWAIDLHPPDGVFSEAPSCVQWHSKGIYQIPYRCFVSKDIDNLFFAGRIISASHVAFGSSRVMATCALGAQAVAMAAVLCRKYQLLPKALLEDNRIRCLQHELSKEGQSIPGITIDHTDDLCHTATFTASSSLRLSDIPFNGPWIQLYEASAQLLPFRKDTTYRFSLQVKAAAATMLRAELRVSSKPYNYTPDVVLDEIEVEIHEGEQQVDLVFRKPVPGNQYGFLILQKNDLLQVKCSQNRYTGILAVFNGKNKAVSNNGRQSPPAGIGIDAFEFWCPRRRPGGNNLAMTISPAISAYEAANAANGFTRPYLGANAWVASLADPSPTLQLSWSEPQVMHAITLFFDTDYDHPLESSLQGHPEDIIPFCLREYRIKDDTGHIVYSTGDNYQAMHKIIFERPVTSSKLTIECRHPSEFTPAAIFEIIIT